MVLCEPSGAKWGKEGPRWLGGEIQIKIQRPRQRQRQSKGQRQRQR